MNIEVIHDKEKQRFYTFVDSYEALLDYGLDGDTMNFYHTYTPPELRGKGLAKIVVEYAFNYAKKNNLKVIPSCSYVRAFVKRYDEYKDLLA